MSQSIIVVTQSHSHDEEFQHSNIEERHSDFKDSHSDEESVIPGKTSSHKPVHEHSIVKINSIKIIGNSTHSYNHVYPAINLVISFNYPSDNFSSAFLSPSFRPPIFA